MPNPDIGARFQDTENEESYTVVDHVQTENQEFVVVQYLNGLAYEHTIEKVQSDTLIEEDTQVSITEACSEGEHEFAAASYEDVFRYETTHPRCMKCGLSTDVLEAYCGQDLHASVGWKCFLCDVVIAPSSEEKVAEEITDEMYCCKDCAQEGDVATFDDAYRALSSPQA